VFGFGMPKVLLNCCQIVFKYDTEGIVKAFQANVRVVVAEESFDDWPSFPVANADRSKGNKQMSNHLTYL